MSELTIAERRAAVVAEAKTWIGTPYHSRATIKGVGADCLTFIGAPLSACGEIPPIVYPRYSPSWHMHHSAELYLFGKDDQKGMLHYCDEVPGPPERVPLPADIVLFKFGRTFSHAAIVIEWPLVIHSYIDRKVSPENAETALYLKMLGEGHDKKNIKPRPRRFFVLKQWMEKP